MIFLKRADDAMWGAGFAVSGRRKHNCPGRGQMRGRVSVSRSRSVVQAV